MIDAARHVYQILKLLPQLIKISAQFNFCFHFKLLSFFAGAPSTVRLVCVNRFRFHWLDELPDGFHLSDRVHHRHRGVLFKYSREASDLRCLSS